ncbi:hypothetical protein [Myroides sp. LJL119]
MKQKILQQIKALGGNIDKVKQGTLQQELISIDFQALLYPKPATLKWDLDPKTEPIKGLSDYIKLHLDLFYNNKPVFFERLLQYFYFDVVDNHGQKIWTTTYFTPLDPSTLDYKEWQEVFQDRDKLDLQVFEKVAKVTNPNFIQLCFGFTHPDHYYILEADPNPDNPTVFATDHSEFFQKVEVIGTLEEFLDGFITPKELQKFVEDSIENGAA